MFILNSSSTKEKINIFDDTLVPESENLKHRQSLNCNLEYLSKDEFSDKIKNFLAIINIITIPSIVYLFYLNRKSIDINKEILAESDSYSKVQKHSFEEMKNLNNDLLKDKKLLIKERINLNREVNKIKDVLEKKTKIIMI